MKAQQIRQATNKLFLYMIKNKMLILQKAADNYQHVQTCLHQLTHSGVYWQHFGKERKIKQKFGSIFELPIDVDDEQFQGHCKRIQTQLNAQIDKIQLIQSRYVRPSLNNENLEQNKQDSIRIQIKPIIKQEQINGNDVQAIVNYNQKLIHKKYGYREYNIEKLINQFVNHFLQNNLITIFSPCQQVSILNCQIYTKSKDAGNYLFDPFCKAIKFQLRFKKQFKDITLKIKGNVKLIFQQTGAGQDAQNLLPGPQEDIKKLLSILCQKKLQTSTSLDNLCKAFKQTGGVKKISDLFEWTKEDYQKIGIRITYVYQLMEMVEISKDQNAIGSKKGELSAQKKECIRVGNSHKILRYLVYRLYGIEILQKSIPLLNYQNMKIAIKIIKAQIINDSLLDDLEHYFFEFTADPMEEVKEDFSRGMVLYGPPGTGKTVLSQTLPSMIGFHLIEKGLSAADFMKSVVGESSRMIKDLVRRARLSPHLLCSLGIDEVDGLVPDRKDKDEKNKGEGISMLLSVIGGNQNVPNLVFMTSTNHIKKIDEAIRRRLSGQFQVGRPNPKAREAIMLKQVVYLRSKPDFINHLTMITSNFTGAAVKRLSAQLLLILRKKIMERANAELSIQQINSITAKVAKQFSITLGIYTLPEIYANHSNKKYLLNLSFLKKIANQFLIASKESKESYTLYYSTFMERYQFNETTKENILTPYYEKGEQTINVEEERNSGIKSIERWVRTNNANTDLIIQTEERGRLSRQQYCNSVQRKLFPREKPTLLLIEDIPGVEGDILINSNLFLSPRKNLFILFYLHEQVMPQDVMEMLGWEINREKNFIGRVLVELTDEPKMVFQINAAQQDQTKLHFRYFLKSQKSQTPNDVIPELVDFYTNRNVSYILLVDYQLVLQNGAYDEQKTLEIIDEKMSEAINYDSVAVIINMDSLIILNQSASDSNMGRSNSYSVADHGLYRLLLQYIKEFPVVDKATKKQKWISIIAKNPELILLLKKDLSWPFTPEQRKERQKQEELDKQKRCVRCGVSYTERQNIQEMKCMQHPGYLINLNMKMLEDNLTLNEAKIAELKFKRMHEKSSDNMFVFACCLKGLNQQGETAYRHIQAGDDDEVSNDREIRKDQWNEICSKL